MDKTNNSCNSLTIPLTFWIVSTYAHVHTESNITTRTTVRRVTSKKQAIPPKDELYFVNGNKTYKLSWLLPRLMGLQQGVVGVNEQAQKMNWFCKMHIFKLMCRYVRRQHFLACECPFMSARTVLYLLALLPSYEGGWCLTPKEPSVPIFFHFFLNHIFIR